MNKNAFLLLPASQINFSTLSIKREILHKINKYASERNTHKKPKTYKIWKKNSTKNTQQ